MAISWNEIKDRALKFSKEWEDAKSEQSDKQTFWNDFFEVFGISRRRVATFEKQVEKIDKNKGFNDLFWPGQLVAEHKSLGKSLDKAFTQAIDYTTGLSEHEVPRYIVTSDFQQFKFYDLEEDIEQEFKLKDFHKYIKLFGFIAGYQKREFKEQDPVNIAAAELMGKLHDELHESGYTGHRLEMYLVRLLFCLFADDTGIFERDIFKEYIEIKTKEDGSDLGNALAQLFQILNEPKENRLKTLDEHMMAFPYVNGKLFEETIPIAAFNSEMRNIILECSALDWGKISPAIFGSLFQSVMDPDERRNLGAHYTSEKNILKLIKPLFLDELKEEFEKVKGNSKKLREFHKKLAGLNFLDPACGCGNFLVITYRELRLLELEVLKALYKNQQVTGIEAIVNVNVDQFYGIEYDEWPARIAEVALWLMDHQMNLTVSEEFGLYYARLPLKKSATIIHDNALRTDWKDIIAPKKLSYILGNPPFYGKQYQTKEQKKDMKVIFDKVKGSGVLDYVTAWYVKAAEYIQRTKVKVAFVSTNSIAQGEQVGVLWNELFKNYMLKIHFAHRTFKWTNEAKGKAAVHVVIIGFGNFDITDKKIFDYENIRGEPDEIKAKNINPYLVQGDDVVVLRRSNPICDVPEISFGNQPNDGGGLILETDEIDEFLKEAPEAKKYVRRYVGSREFIQGKDRWCLWLKGANPKELKSIPKVMEKIEQVKEHRLNSSRKATNELAKTPTLFGYISHKDTPYVIIPSVSSERRVYVPIGFMDADIIASNLCLTVNNANIFHFGCLTSEMHMAWLKYVGGRLKSDYRYSNSIVYNNFPWPKEPSAKNKKLVENWAQKILDARAEFKDSSLADLYDPLTMPLKLVKAHQKLDKAVDLCYRPQPFTTETNRIEFLFELYKEYTEPLLKQKQ